MGTCLSGHDSNGPAILGNNTSIKQIALSTMCVVLVSSLPQQYETHEEKDQMEQGIIQSHTDHTSQRCVNVWMSADPERSDQTCISKIEGKQQEGKPRYTHAPIRCPDVRDEAAVKESASKPELQPYRAEQDESKSSAWHWSTDGWPGPRILLGSTRAQTYCLGEFSEGNARPTKRHK